MLNVVEEDAQLNLTDAMDVLLAFHDYPAENCIQLRIEPSEERDAA